MVSNESFDSGGGGGGVCFVVNTAHCMLRASFG